MKKCMACVLVMALFLSFSLSVSADFISEEIVLQPVVSEPHVYDVLPGTNEWNTMTPQERYLSCYVSSAEAERMTTSALLETVLNYPYIVDICAFNTFEQGIAITAERFPPLRELLDRDDATAVINGYTSQNSVFTRSDEINTQFVDALLIKSFVENIDTYGDSAGIRYVSSSVSTPNGTSVSAKYNQTWTDISRQYLQNRDYDYAYARSLEMLEVYPSATMIRNPSPAYNCHSYALYSQASTNLYWIDDPSAYFTDGSYVTATAAVGNIAVYKTGNTIIHTGIFTSAGSVWQVTSKWGFCGLFRHNVADCPYRDPNSNSDEHLYAEYVSVYRQA